MISIWKFTDGYYSVGEEGQNKCFVPDYNLVLDYLDKYHNGLRPKLTSNKCKVYYANKSFNQYICESCQKEIL